MDLEREIDRLYALPLAEFVPARKELTVSLREAGDRDSAARVGKLPKASATAWAINRLWDEARDEMEALFAAGGEVRAALERGTGSAEALVERRRLTSDLLSRAEAILSDAGHGAGRVARQRLSHTLDALAATGGASDPPPGRLVRDLEPPGFEMLAGLELPAASGAKPGRRARKPAKRKRGTRSSPPRAKPTRRETLAQKAIERAHRKREVAAAAHRKRREELEAAKRSETEAQQAGEELVSRMRKAEAELKRARRAVKTATDAEGRAASKLAAAERELEEATSGGER